MADQPYQPPTSIWDASANLDFDEVLEVDDPRFVSLDKARGDSGTGSLLKQLCMDPKTLELKAIPERKYILFGGHRGCGKSTELRRLKRETEGPERFFVVFLDAVKNLDINNIHYSDILLAQANSLLEKLDKDNIAIDSIFLRNLKSWFHQRIELHEETKAFASEITAGAKGKVGIPLLIEFFAALTNSVRINSTYKEEVRNVIRNSFSQFADAFNQLIIHAEKQIKKAGKGRKILFIIDGTDRLSGKDTKRFFIDDVHQLKLVESNFIYCAPIDLLTEGGQAQQTFSGIFRLPMVKIAEKGAEDKIEPAYEALRKLIYQRADRSLFDSEETVDYFIRYSGGHLRELIRLLNYAFQVSAAERFDRAAAEQAVKQLATDYRRYIEENDYKLLVQIDKGAVDHAPNTEQTKRLLYDLILLEYNSYWWQSHPVVQTLPGYIKSRNAGKIRI